MYTFDRLSKLYFQNRVHNGWVRNNLATLANVTETRGGVHFGEYAPDVTLTKKKRHKAYGLIDSINNNKNALMMKTYV